MNPFNTRLLPVTNGVTMGFEFSNALEIFSNPQDLSHLIVSIEKANLLTGLKLKYLDKLNHVTNTGYIIRKKTII